MDQMSRQDKEIQRSANEAVPHTPRPTTPLIEEDDERYKEILSLIDTTFGLPSDYIKCKMFDYKDRPDVLINIWVPDPNQDELALIRQSIILSYRYQKGKITKP